jgi:hypothetical protein
MQDVIPPDGTPFCGCTQGLWVAAEEEEAALEELLGVIAAEDEEAAGLEFAGLLELGLLATELLEFPAGLLELLEIVVLLELLEWPEPPELPGSTVFSSLLEQEKKTPLIAKASKNKIPDTLFILQSPNTYLLIPMGK